MFINIHWHYVYVCTGMGYISDDSVYDPIHDCGEIELSIFVFNMHFKLAMDYNHFI